MSAQLHEICIAACADCFRGDGEIMASPMGMIPTVGARLARATFEPDLVLTDGISSILAGNIPVGVADAPKIVEGWMPYRLVFDTLWNGRRHVMMGASQIDPHGNQNISAIGNWRKPKRQLLGARGAPGNTINHTTSYWIPNHSPQVFVRRVNFVSGIGYDRAAKLGSGARFHEIRRVVTNLAVLDFETPDRRMRLRSVHPGVTVEDVIRQTGFELAIAADAGTTRTPTDEELKLIRDVLDPRSIAAREIARS